MIRFHRADENPDSADSRWIWEWRMDPTSRRMSKATDLIPWEDHKKWYARAARDPQRVVLIASVDGAPACMVRFDYLDAARAEISINMNPALRGRGHGRSVLAAACAHGFDTLKLERIDAQIRSENAASIKIFESVGFRFQDEQQDVRTYCITRAQLERP